MIRSFLLVLCFSFLAFPGFSQDSIRNSGNSESKSERDGRFYIRGGIGAQGMISFIFPEDVNNFTKDFYNNLEEYFTQYGFSPSTGQSPPSIFAGYGYSFKADLRVLNIFQLEPWWDQFSAFPLNMKVDFYYYDTYNNKNERLTATYQFKPFYDEKGVSLIFVPGSKRKKAFVTVGGGVGIMEGKFLIKTDGTHTLNGVVDDLSSSETYSGKTVSYHGVIGVTIVPWKYLELELLINGRYARIPRIKNADGEVLTNEFGDKNEVVSLNLSGADIRFGLKFIFP